MGSDELAEIYKDAFALSEENILKTGIPRTDLFFNEKRKNDIRMNILMENPFLKEKRLFYMLRLLEIRNCKILIYTWK